MSATFATAEGKAPGKQRTVMLKTVLYPGRVPEGAPRSMQHALQHVASNRFSMICPCPRAACTPSSLLVYPARLCACNPHRQRLQEVQRVQGEDGEPRGAAPGHRRQQAGVEA